MKLRPSEDVWTKLDMILNGEEKTNANFNGIIVIFSFLILFLLGAMFFMH